MSKTQYAPTEDRQIDVHDTRKKQHRLWKKLLSFLSVKKNCLIILCLCAGLPFLSPGIFFDTCRLVFIMELIVFISCNMKPEMPMRFPKSSPMKDWNQTDRKGKPSDADGIMFVGNDDYGRELWLNSNDMRTHMMIFGSTGSGKTVTLSALALNGLSMGSGLCYIDPKGDVNLIHDLFAMARRLNREDDFFLLDFMTGDRPSEEFTPFRISNTMNPLATASAPTICNLLNSLLPSEDGNNAIFQQKASMLLDALMPVLTELRDAKVALPLTDMTSTSWGKRRGEFGSGLNINTLGVYIEATACVSLIFPMKAGNTGRGRGRQAEINPGEKQEVEEECDAVARYVSPQSLNTLRNALISLNYVPNGGSVENQKAFQDQFGYARSYFGKPLASLGGMYKHIFNVSNGEIDITNILFNRKILVGVLPAMEKSKTEIENMGKIILASMKNATSPGLGIEVEGTSEKKEMERLSSARNPGLIIVDEYAAIMMQGFEVMLTQARSLNFMTIIASQDLTGMKDKDAKSTGQIMENTTIKLFMRMVNAGDTLEMANKLFGQVNIEETDLNNPEKRGAIKSVNRISQEDLFKQKYGEFHAFYNGDLIRGSTRFMKVGYDRKLHHVRINHFIRTDCAKSLILENMELEKLESAFAKPLNNNEWLEKIKSECAIGEICALSLAGN